MQVLSCSADDTAAVAVSDVFVNENENKNSVNRKSIVLLINIIMFPSLLRNLAPGNCRPIVWRKAYFDVVYRLSGPHNCNKMLSYRRETALQGAS